MAATLAPTQLLLVASDVDTDRTDYTDLMRVRGDVKCFVQMGTFHLPPPGTNTAGSYRRRDGTAITLDGKRQITLDLLLQAPTGEALADVLDDIDRRLDQAERATGDPGGSLSGPPIALWVAELSEVWTLFDVVSGDLTEKQRDYGPNATQVWTLTLVCLEAGRGLSYLYPPSPITIQSGLAASAFIPAVPGNLPALCQGLYQDTGAGAVINQYREYRRGGEALQDGGFAAHLKAIAGTDGSDVSDDSATKRHPGDAHGVCERITAGPAPKTLAFFHSPGGAFDNGRMDLRVVVRDNGGGIGPPLDLVVTRVGGGSFGEETPLRIQVTALDGGGHESGATAPVSVLVFDTMAAKCDWVPPSGAVDHRVYVTSGDTVGYFDTGSGAGTFTITSFSGLLAGSPPATPSIAALPALWQASVALDVPHPPFWIPGPVVPSAKGGGVWERLPLGPLPCPPLPRQQQRGQRPFVIRLQAWSQNSATPALDVDYLSVCPHDEPQRSTSYYGLNLETRGLAQIDTRADGATSGVLLDLEHGADVAQLSAIGQFTLSPGGNVVGLDMDVAGGVPDLTAQCAAQWRITPRFRGLRGYR